MGKHPRFLSFLLFLSIISFCEGIRENSRSVLELSNEQCNGKKKLFVFGDSYLDTGNGRDHTGAFNKPYGITFPGEPSGRFSDGRVLTDYIASFLGIDSPVPYEQRNTANKAQLQSGMNFAYGGSGIYDTLWNNENMSVQMGKFERVITDEKVYTQSDLQCSVVLVSTSGNDYATFLQQPRSNEELSSYIQKVVEQLSKNLQAIYDMGVGKVAVASMGRSGCVPEQVTNSSRYPENCNELYNSKSRLHNEALKLSVQKLNDQAHYPAAFVLLDFYGAFASAMDQHAETTENPEYKNPTTACCKGATPMSCGEVDNTGKKMYTLCDHPELSFFWDAAHPSQHGWQSVYSALADSLNQLK